MKSNNPIIDLSSHSLNEIDESIALCENLVVVCSVMMDQSAVQERKCWMLQSC